MKHNHTAGSLLPFLLLASIQSREISSVNPEISRNMYGAIGYNGFTGSNKDKKKHFNKKRHGRMLRKKHAR